MSNIERATLRRRWGLVLVAVLVLVALGSVPAAASPGTLEVSLPVQVTDSSYYERGQSIVYDGSDYWLFYGRSDTITGNYDSTNPDTHDYKVYYKKASSVADLAAASATLVSGAGVTMNANSYLGETGAAVFGGDVWAFATIDVGATAELYSWYTGDGGTTWSEVGPIEAGLSDGQAHHDEIAFGGELWGLEGSGNFTTKHSATPKTGGWTTPLMVGSTTGGLGHFYAHGTDLYVALFSGTTNYIYHYNSGTVAWDLVDSVTPPEKYDPTLFQVGSAYVYAQAPWVTDGTPGGRQYIIAWSAGALDGSFFDAGHHAVTEGKYGTNSWVDMWPIGFTVGSDSYLFYTSERDEPTAEGTGNIWYLKVDWDLSRDHYTYIQEAIDAAGAGDTINVADGTYDLHAPININQSVTLVGDTVTPSNVVINAPTVGVAPHPRDRDCFQVQADNVTIEGFRIQGAHIEMSGGGDGWQNAGIVVGGDPAMIGGISAPIYGVGYTVIRHNEITDNSYGIHLYRSQHTTVAYNEIYANTQDGNWSGKGILMYSQNYPGTDYGIQIHDIDVLNNRIYDNELMGVELNSTDVTGDLDLDILFEGNVIYSNGGPLDSLGYAFSMFRGISANGTADASETNVTITNNEIYNHWTESGTRFYNGNAGIRPYGPKNWIITNNDLHDNLAAIRIAGSLSTGNTITGNEIHDNAQGIRFEAGVSGAAHQNSLHDNDVTTYVTDGYDPYSVSNLSAVVFDASANWWGSADPAAVSATVSGDVDYTPLVESAIDDELATPGFQPDLSSLTVHALGQQAGTSGRIQEGIDLVTASTVKVAPGLYSERIVIDKPLHLRGATYAVNKNGYSVPAGYAWDPAVESIINNPDPALSTSNLVDIVDTDDVILEGFVIQSLNAVPSSANDQLLRVYAQTKTISNIMVRNNVIGPNTNVTSQDGTNGRMGLYLALPNYTDRDIIDSTFAGNKIFDCQGNGNNVFVWGNAEAYNPSERGQLTGTVIEDNEIYGSHRSGIEIAGSADDLTIRNNRIYGNSGLPTDDPTNLKFGNGIVVIRMGSDKTSPTAQGPDNLTIQGNEIYGNEKNGIYLGPIDSNHVIAQNSIHDNGWDGIQVDLTEQYYGGGWPVFDRTTGISANQNSLVNNGDYGAQVVGTPTNGFTLDASADWWGSADPGTVSGMVSGAVDYTPLVESAADSSTDPGFQPDLSSLTVHALGQQAGTSGRIQEGMNLVTASTVNVEPGTYNETITFGASFGKSNLTILGDASSRPVVNGGVLFQNTGALNGLALENLVFTGDAGSNKIFKMDAVSGSVNDFSMDNCVLDGENVSGRIGIYGNKFGQSFSITNSEFKNILGFAVMDLDGSSDYSPWGGNGLPLTTVTFANNHVHHCNGSVPLRGHYTSKTTAVNVYGNTFEFIGGNGGETGEQWAALEINHAQTANIYNNTVDQVSLGVYGEGQAFQLWDVDTLDMHDNTITDNYQGIFGYCGSSGGSYGGPYAVPGGAVYDNTISGNTQYGAMIESALCTGGPLDAEFNWWGHVSGPYHATTNASGTGNQVGDNIDYSPWRGAVKGTTPMTWVTNDSIQDAIDAASNGDTIIVKPGTYPESVNVNKSVTLIMEPGVLILPSSPCFTVSADNITLSGGICVPFGGSDGIVTGAAVNNLVIKNMEIRNGSGTGDGIHLGHNITNLQILDNYVHHMGGDGLEYASSTAVGGVHEIQGNLFHYNTGYGVNNASGNTYIVEYNSWGHLSGPSSGDGASGSLDYTPWTHVAIDMLSSESPVPDKVAVDATIKYTIRMDAAEVWGADFDLAFDETMLEVVSIANGGSFAQYSLCGLSTASEANASGVISFCGDRTSAGIALNGAAQPVFVVVLKGLAPGPVDLDLDQTDDAFGMAPPSGASNNIYAHALTDGSVTVYDHFLVTGRIDLQGRANDSGAVMAFGLGAGQGYGPYTFGTSDYWGSIGASGVVEDTYAITVRMARYLDVTAASGRSASISGLDTSLSTLVLLGGDADGDDVDIGISDATIIGGAYGTHSGDPGWAEDGDINADSMISILDLAIMGGNYGKTSATAYAGWTP